MLNNLMNQFIERLSIELIYNFKICKAINFLN